MAEVAVARGRVEAETLADAEAIIHRLRSHEAGKLARLRTAADACAADIAAIDALDAAIRGFGGGVGDTGGAGATVRGGGGGAAASPPPWASGSALALTGGGGGGPPSVSSLAIVRVYPELCAEADRLLARQHDEQVRTWAAGWRLGGGGMWGRAGKRWRALRVGLRVILLKVGATHSRQSARGAYPK